MNSEIGGWLTSGRSTKRSVTMPNTIMMTSASTSATPNGAPFARMPTNDSAAKYTIAPCAKLKTPDAL